MFQNDLVVCIFILSSDSIFRQQSICRYAPGGRSWQADSIQMPCRYAREDALGKLGGAVAEGAQLIEDLYQAFYQELQKPLASPQAGPNKTAKDSTHGQSSQGAHESPQSEAAAKVTSQQIGSALCVVGRTHFASVHCCVTQQACHNTLGYVTQQACHKKLGCVTQQACHATHEYCSAQQGATYHTLPCDSHPLYAQWIPVEV